MPVLRGGRSSTPRRDFRAEPRAKRCGCVALGRCGHLSSPSTRPRSGHQIPLQKLYGVARSWRDERGATPGPVRSGAPLGASCLHARRSKRPDFLTVAAAIAEHLPAEARVVGRVPSAVALPVRSVDVSLQVDAGLGAVRQIASPPAILSFPAGLARGSPGVLALPLLGAHRHLDVQAVPEGAASLRVGGLQVSDLFGRVAPGRARRGTRHAVFLVSSSILGPRPKGRRRLGAAARAIQLLRNRSRAPAGLCPVAEGRG